MDWLFAVLGVIAAAIGTPQNTNTITGTESRDTFGGPAITDELADPATAHSDHEQEPSRPAGP